MAGVPMPVVDRAREVVTTATGDASASDADSQPTPDTDTATDPTASASATDDALADALSEQALDAEAVAAVAAELHALDIATMTPLEALNTLDALRSRLADA
jgi:DNA mismatch repair protein MutS